MGTLSPIILVSYARNNIKNNLSIFMKNKFYFKEIELAFSTGYISLESFIEILVDNFGKKKARKILRHNVEIKMKEEGLPWPQRQENLLYISLLV